MTRKGKGNEPDVTAVQRFAELFSSHLDRGTRPNGTPDTEGVRWTVKEFAAAVHADERSVRAWRNGEYLPKDLTSIEKQLFDDNAAYRDAIDKLRRLHREARRGILNMEAASDLASQDADVATSKGKRAEPDQVQPGYKTIDLIEDEFRTAIAYFQIGAGRVLLVPRADTVLLGFKEVVDRLMAIERADNQERMLIWTLDLGKQVFEDPESRLKFMNVESLATRFRALRRFREDVTAARWDWLHSRAIIALHDTRNVRPAVPRLPDFDPQHVLFSAIPPRWAESPNFQALYGHEHLQETNYTIFLRRGATHHGLRYFGHALFRSKLAGEYEARGLELIPPGQAYVEALGTLYAAAAQRLGLRSLPTALSIDGVKINPEHAIEKLRHHGFLLLRLNEFMAL